MPGPHHRRREYAGPGAVAEALLNPAWSHLEPLPPASKRSGLTSSDDAPRYRRGSKRRPKPPKTPPGLVQPLRDSVALARFPGRGLGYAAVAEIPATTLLFQERPLTIADTFADAEEARRALARAMAANSLRDREGGVGGGGGPAEPAAEPSQLRERLNGASKKNATVFEPSPFKDEGIDDESWNDALRRARRDAQIRRAKKGEADRSVAAAALRGETPGTNPPNVDPDFVVVENTTPQTDERSFETTRVKEKEAAHSEEGVYVARIAAHVSRLNHSCRPNAAVSAGDGPNGVTTVYSLRAIAPGEEICVSYASAFLWLPVHARRAQLAKRWGFLCACARCDEELARAAAERDCGAGAGRAQASRFGARRAGGVDSRAAREAERDAGFRAWEYGETGFENQFDDEGGLRSSSQRSEEGLANGDSRRDGVSEGRDGVGLSASEPDSSTSDSSTSDSSDSDSDDVDPGGPASRRSVGSNGSWRKRGAKKRRGDRERGGAVVGAARLYVKLSRAGIGPDHWQMHATREALVSKLLSAEGRKDFDLDLLLEHAQCAARLAPNHPHFVRLVTLVEEVFKSNRDVIVAEQFWVWTIELLREAVHPDVLFWNTEFKGMPGYRAVEEDVRTNAR